MTLMTETTATPIALPENSAAGSLQIGHVALVVRDRARVAGWYRQVLGLEEIAHDGEVLRLGVAGRTLVELRADPAARRGSPREAGLFHTAFLMPRRADLGAWLHHAVETRIAVQGASDHLVSEALYLADPEGNGVEIYVDRPRSDWGHTAGGIEMATEALDLPALAAAAEARWHGAPAGLVVGHVHLQVGQLDQAEPFYRDTLGLALTTRYPGAAFWGWDGYHHHLATNIWNSRGAGRRTEGATGLAEVALLADPAGLARLPATAEDPWGTRFSVAPGQVRAGAR